MLDDELKASLGRYLEYLQRPIAVTAALDDGPAAAEMR